MKLGEAGEAFFVEELENDISDSLGSSLPSSKRHVENQKDDDLSNEVSSKFLVLMKCGLEVLKLKKLT